MLVELLNNCSAGLYRNSLCNNFFDAEILSRLQSLVIPSEFEKFLWQVNNPSPALERYELTANDASFIYHPDILMIRLYDDRVDSSAGGKKFNYYIKKSYETHTGRRLINFAIQQGEKWHLTVSKNFQSDMQGRVTGIPEYYDFSGRCFHESCYYWHELVHRCISLADKDGDHPSGPICQLVNRIVAELIIKEGAEIFAEYDIFRITYDNIDSADGTIQYMFNSGDEQDLSLMRVHENVDKIDATDMTFSLSKSNMQLSSKHEERAVSSYHNTTLAASGYSDKSIFIRKLSYEECPETVEKQQLQFFPELLVSESQGDFATENIHSVLRGNDDEPIDVFHDKRDAGNKAVFNAESYQELMTKKLSEISMAERCFKVSDLTEMSAFSRKSAEINAITPSYDSGGMSKISKKGYIFLPLIGDDAIEHILMHTSKQIMNGKEPYTIILERKSDRVLFERSKQLYKSLHPFFFAEKQHPAADIRSRKSRKQMSNIKKAAGMQMAYEKMTVITCEEDNALALLNPASTKLYISSHGEAGDSYFYFKFGEGFREIHSRTMVEKLLQVGLPSNYQDIRLTACHSANGLEAGDFSDRTLNKIDTQRDSSSLAQQFSADMHRAGYIESTITGYHGEGKPLPAVNKYGKYYSVREAENGDRIRRSELRKRF